MPPGPRVLYVLGTRTSLGRTARTAHRTYRVPGAPWSLRQRPLFITPGGELLSVSASWLDRSARPSSRGAGLRPRTASQLVFG